jgi:hypothetical protein
MNNFKRTSYVNLHFVSNKPYTIFQNRSEVLKIFFHVPPKYYSASLSTTYLRSCHVRRERVMLCAEKLCFIICNLYYNAWIAHRLKMLHIPPVVRVRQFENRWKRLESYDHTGWGPRAHISWVMWPALSSKLASPDISEPTAAAAAQNDWHKYPTSNSYVDITYLQDTTWSKSSCWIMPVNRVCY